MNPWRRFSALLLSAVLLTSCSLSGVQLPSFGVVPPFQLTDQSGQSFESDKQLKGKVWVANFIFTNCAGPCPRMSGQFSQQIRDRKGDIENYGDLRFVSFTIDPARDTPPVLAEYARRFSADPNQWFFLTGSQANLHNLSRNVFLLGDVNGQLEHSTRFALVDRHSRIRGFYDSTDAEKMAQFNKDLASLTRSGA